VPQVDTKLSMRGCRRRRRGGYFREGMAFSPMYTLGIKKSSRALGSLRTWLKVEKAS
jgi:hypothetical protein